MAGLAGLDDELVAAVERLGRSVVHVRRGLGREASWMRMPAEASGTGLIVDSLGFVVTNDHVVRGVDQAEVSTFDGRSVVAKVVGGDAATDLALLRIDGHNFEAATLADSSSLRVGQLALAMGNSLGLPGGPTVSLGVISALGRPLPGADFIFEGLVQTDAAVNPGNSGGPLANRHGDVIGINAAMVPFAQGVGFAIPSNTVQTVVQQLRTNGRVVRPWLGISAMALDSRLASRLGLGSRRGVVVSELESDGPAASAGVEAGDVIVRAAGRDVVDLRDLLRSLSTVPLGGIADLAVVRESRERKLMVRVQESPRRSAALPAE